MSLRDLAVDWDLKTNGDNMFTASLNKEDGLVTGSLFDHVKNSDLEIENKSIEIGFGGVEKLDGKQLYASASNRASDSLSKYVPTEVLTLFVAYVGVEKSLKSTTAEGVPSWIGFLPTIGFWVFVVLTPIATLAAFAIVRTQVGKSKLPENKSDWPWYRIVAATLSLNRPGFAGDSKS